RAPRAGLGLRPELARARQAPPARPDAQPRAHEHRRGPGQGPHEQTSVHETEVVRDDDDRSARGHVLDAADLGVPHDACEEPPDAPRPSRRSPWFWRAHRRLSTSERTTSTVSSIVSSEESTVTTPSAASRKLVTAESTLSRPTTR